MISNKYKYAFVDFSGILQKNLFGVSKDKKPGEYTAGDLIRSCIYTFNKIYRDFGVSADKMVLLLDKWDGGKGYITTQILGGAYKDSRGDIESEKGKANPLGTYMTKEKYEAMKSDPTVSKEDLDEAYEKLYKNDVRQAAKRAIAQNLKLFGVPSLSVPGWEFDNLAYLASMMLFSIDDKPSIIVTQDSDLNYSTTPKCPVLKLPRSGQDPQIITYDEMYNEIPEDLRDQISLYAYKSYWDSLGATGSHNGMRRTKKQYCDANQVIQEILHGDYTNVEDVDLFKKQLSTFDISKYPRFEEAKRNITDLLPTCGRLGTLKEWHDFLDKYEIHGLSDSFFTTFISRFDPTLYTERI
jgi:hypothetical protein